MPAPRPGHDRSRIRVLAVALAAVAITATGCTNREPARFAASGGSTVTATVDASGTQRVEVAAGMDDRFTPSTIVVHPGRVMLVVHNTGGTPHTLEIPDLDVDTGNIGSHATKSVTFTVHKPGTYRFDCAYHVTLGMTGTLKVVSG